VCSPTPHSTSFSAMHALHKQSSALLPNNHSS
jgi:hypothetical protein